MIFWWSSGSSRGSAMGIALIGLVLGVVMSASVGVGSTTTRAILFVIPLFLISLPVVLMSLRRANTRSASKARAAVEPQKAKPKHGESLGELMSILNDEDIDDLRARVKARLEEQIDSADADEIESFEDLLDETKRKRR